MIVDYRIYCSIYAAGLLASFVVCEMGMATVDNARTQRLLTRIMAALASVLSLTGLTHFLDWLWS